MRIESVKPGEIAGYTDLESLAVQNSQVLFDILDEEVAKGQGMTFDDIELDMPLLLPYATSLARFLHGFDAPHEATATTQRALGFSVFISQQLCFPRQWSMSFASFTAIEGDDELFNYVHDAPAKYLSQRPMLDAFVGRYLPEISPDPHFHHGAALAVGLTLLQVEEHLFERFESERVAELMKDIDTWDSEFPTS